MPITNFEFPSVTLKQKFVALTTGTSSKLGVCCIGLVKKAHVIGESDSSDTYISTSSQYTGATTLVVNMANLPGFTSTSTAFEVFKVVAKNITYSDNTTADSQTLTATTNYTTTASALTILASIKKSGSSTITISKCDFYVEYNETLANTYVNEIGSLSEPTAAVSMFGPATPNNPFGAVLFFAVSAAKGNTVYFTGVSAATATAYTNALAILSRKPEIYSIVPATEDTDILKACFDACVNDSEDEESKVRRTLWFGITSTQTTAAAIVTDCKTKKAAVATSYRAQCVWADGITYNGNTFNSYVAAAAAAGMRSYEPVQRPLSNLGYTFFSLSEAHGLSREQLKEIASNGIWVIANSFDGTPINMKQLTTAAQNDINQDEESIISNSDEIALALCRVGEKKVGCSNISSQLLMALSDDITILMDARLRNTTGDLYIGPQLLDWSLDEMYQDSANMDHVIATISCTPPKPFNKFQMTLRVL